MFGGVFAHAKKRWMFILALSLCLLAVSELILFRSAGATTQTFSSTTSWTAPAGVTSVTVEVWGGGGGGGGARNNGGAGGGGGGYAKQVVTVVPGNSYTVTVGTGGAGGAGGNPANPGTAGNPSWFNTTGTVFAAGGTGGGAAATVGTPGVGGGTGGAGGTNIGSITHTGGNGGVGAITGGIRSGAGGGGAGSSNDGGAGADGNAGGAAGTGGATSGGNGGAGTNVSGSANAGTTMGGGGGGAFSTSNGTQPTGGAGARGQVVLTYVADTVAPMPNPMTFATAPNNPAIAGTTTISMVATTATDASSSPVSYYFDATTTPTCGSKGGTGADDSGWQSGTSYSDTGLQANKCYSYMVAARDTALNKTASSSVVNVYTSALKPGAPTLSNATLSTLTLTNAENGNPPSNPTTKFAIRIASSTPNDTHWVGKYVNGSGASSTSAVWLTDAQIDGLVVTGLHATTTYSFESVAENEDGDRSATSSKGNGYTQDVTAPTPNPPYFTSPPSNNSSSQISMTSVSVTDTATPVSYSFATTTDAANWTAQSAVGNDDYWTSIAYGTSTFVAVGYIGDRVMTSSNGSTWTSRSAAGDNDDWQGITYGNGLFVAVGCGGASFCTSSTTGDHVMTSPNGTTWTVRSAAGNNDTWRSVTYGNGLFVAVGDATGGADPVMTSPDGITWTARSAGGSNDLWQSVTYGNGLFVAVGDSISGTDSIMTSPDGTNWTVRTAPTTNRWYGVTYGNGQFVAVGYYSTNNRSMTSSDGINWTSHPTAGNSSSLVGVSYANGLFVAVANGGTYPVVTSPDGTNWMGHSAAGNNDSWHGVTYGNGLFVAVGTGGSGDHVMTSTPTCGGNTGTGAANSGWQGSASYTSSGLQPNKCYLYTISARDNFSNKTSTSSASSTYTSAATPGAITFTSVTGTSITLHNTENGNPSSNPTTQFAVHATSSDSSWNNKYVNSSGSPSASVVWLTDAQIDGLALTGLGNVTTYSFTVVAKNQDGDLTASSTPGATTTRDSTAPTPNPMTFSSAPNNASSTQIDMTATTASDSSTPIAYLFSLVAGSCGANGGTGGTASSWQSGTSYSDTGLQANKCYAYAVAARDSFANTTASSSVTSVYTSAAIPGALSYSTRTASSFTLLNAENGNPSSNPTTQFAVHVNSSSDAAWSGKYVDGSGNASTSAVWLSDAQIDGLIMSGLQANTSYTMEVKARNQDGDATSFGAQATLTTDVSVAPRGIIRFFGTILNGLRLGGN